MPEGNVFLFGVEFEADEITKKKEPFLFQVTEKYNDAGTLAAMYPETIYFYASLTT